MRGALKGQEFVAPTPAPPPRTYEIPTSTKYSQGVLAVYEACRCALTTLCWYVADSVSDALKIKRRHAQSPRTYEVPTSTRYSQGVLAVYRACRCASWQCLFLIRCSRCHGQSQVLTWAKSSAEHALDPVLLCCLLVCGSNCVQRCLRHPSPRAVRNTSPNSSGSQAEFFAGGARSRALCQEATS